MARAKQRNRSNGKQTEQSKESGTENDRSIPEKKRGSEKQEVALVSKVAAPVSKQ